MNQSDLEKIRDIFSSLGGEFIISPEKIRDALNGTYCFVFDWDGVFNSGQKGEKYVGVFSEADSMGINMLRYGYWLRKREVPYIVIITGENNETAFKFAHREHITAVYRNFNDKRKAVEHICETMDIKSNQIACIFDDVNDLSMCQICGLRIQVRGSASPLFMRYIAKYSLCDYVTGHTGKEYAVREVCELFLGLMGIYEQVVQSRVSFDETYQSFWKARNEIKPNCFIGTNGKVIFKRRVNISR